MMRFLSTVFWLAILAIAVLFTTMNAKTIAFNYYIGSGKIFLPLLLFIAFAIGIFLGMIALLPAFLRVKNQLRKTKNQLSKAEKEVNNLRA